MAADELFRASLTEKYGTEILTDFDNLLNQNGISMTCISKKYGFTRERARQLFEKINKFHFTVIKNQRKASRKEQVELKRQLKKDPRNKVSTYKNGDNNVYKAALAEEKVMNICIALGYEIKPFTENRNFDLVVNGFNIDVKSAYYSALLTTKNRTPLFHFQRSESQRHADFIICYAEPINKYFVIPGTVFPTGNHLYIPEKPENSWTIIGNWKKHSRSKWYDYLEAWHLLKPQPQEVIFNRAHTAQAVTICSTCLHPAPETGPPLKPSTERLGGLKESITQTHPLSIEHKGRQIQHGGFVL